MEKYLITGISGFVAAHFLHKLNVSEEVCEVLGLDRHEPVDFPQYRNIKLSIKICDLFNLNAITKILIEYRPTKILHLASISSVASSWLNPVESFLNNTNIFLNIVESLRSNNLKARILSVGSSEEYGVFPTQSLPLKEDHPLNPTSPYAVARVAQEQLSKVYVNGFGLDIVMTRSFNHIGPGQKPHFAVASFVKQVVDAVNEKKSECELTVGDISVVRDFLDVRDVVEAYWLLLKNGRSGEVYNVCSGIGTSLELIIQELELILGIKIKTHKNPALIRPNELPVIIGVNEKIKSELNWVPQFSLRKTLEDVCDQHLIK